jgi:hypothetical protein
MGNGGHPAIRIQGKIDSDFVAASWVVGGARDMRPLQMTCAMRIGGQPQNLFLVERIAHRAR